MITSETERWVKQIIFGGLIAIFIFLFMQIWSYYDLHLWLIKKISNWTLRTKIEFSTGAAVVIIAGAFFSFKSLRRNMRNATYFDR